MTFASARRALWLLVRWPLSAIGILVFGAGVPYLWVWIGSQLQGGTAPSITGLGVALLGIIVSYSLMAFLLAWLKAWVTQQPSAPVRHDWNRSLSAERRGAPDTHPIEDMVMAATILVGIVCTAWFLMFGNPGVPVAP
jgi:divalent metal cation (Fe/Co/Zn/Cd) transporter